MADFWWWLYSSTPVLIVGAYLLKGMMERRGRLRRWVQSVKAACRTNEVETSRFLALRARLEVKSGPSTVRITNALGDKENVVVTLEGPEGFSVLKLRRQLLWSGARDIELGDESFDSELIVEGPVRRAAAWLDETTRGRLLHALAKSSSLEIGEGRLRAEVNEDALDRILPTLLDIGQRFDKSEPVEQKIAQNARHDAVPGARLFNLLLLVREHPGDPDTLQVLRRACSDESPTVRLRAAIELGEEGRDVLQKLAKGSADDASSAQAVTRLGRELSLESLRDILFRAVSESRLLQTALACLEELGRRQAAAVDVLAQVMARQSGELAVAAAQALGATGEASAEPPLLQALQSEDGDLREAAAAALGLVGSTAAVQPLQEAAERSWPGLSLRRSANQAIAEIQSRLVGASPGQLSLAGADGEMGRLSLATADAGQLSLATDTAGELALLPHEAETEGAPGGLRVSGPTSTSSR